ncbi:TPA: hypothetical protein N0F65_009744 [Lagenidium giganteum]|uniref:TatD related DNase n=1 Tax=Lagenidium giganteum TaxID=4803 RepID=A0AAV2YP56_9STRA|nr:TPA: hypothetical protein N0F65_009744 [Lagenidium giganteum]
MKAGVVQVVSCACHEDDWVALDGLMGQLPNGFTVVPAFGIHPWWADAASDACLDALKQRLEANSRACLGEIGLCKSLRGKAVDRATQERAFQQQLQLATTLQRPVIVHCVKSFGKVLEIMQREQELPPRIVMHSFNGASDIVKSFIKLEQNASKRTRVFFSLNAKQLSENKEKASAWCRAIPLPSLLLETDAPDQLPATDSVMANMDAEITQCLAEVQQNEPVTVQLALLKAAEALSMTPEELAEIVNANALEAFHIQTDCELYEGNK